MAAKQGLEALQARKRELLAESDLNRQVLRLEAGQIQLRMERLKRVWRQNRWKWTAPVAGFLLARKFKMAGGLFAKGSFVFLALRKLWDAWQSRKH